MITIDILHKLIQKEGKLLEHEAVSTYSKLHSNFKDFVFKIEEEGTETKTAFNLLKNHIVDSNELTDQQKEEIGNQMKDVLKTIGLVGLAALPGGSLFFVLFHFLKINKYVMPSAFLKPIKENVKK